MRLRRLNSSGIELTRQFLKAVKESNNIDEVVLNGQTFTRSQLITNPSYSSEVSALSDIDLDEARQFETTYDFCEYFDSLIHDHNPQAYREDVGFWTWLAMVYLPQLVSGGVKIKIGAEPRLIYNASSHMLRHRHLLCYSYYLYNFYRDTPEICNVILCHEINLFSDLVEQLISRQFITQNPALLKAASILYFDPVGKKIKKGAVSTCGGTIRRFITFVDQLSLTRDFFDKEDSDKFIQLLPSEFNKFKNDL